MIEAFQPAPQSLVHISVIVCTRNRASSLPACLDSIAASVVAAASSLKAEIVVVDNGSTDMTSAVVKEWAANSSVPVQSVFEPKSGLSVARNCGVRAARGDLFVFTDDDCRLDKHYIENLLRQDADQDKLVLRGGRVERGDQSDLSLTVKTDLQKGRWQRNLNAARHENIGNCLLGCNMAMRRAVIARIGLFDERLGAGTSIQAGEDTDAVFRAYLADVAIEYVPDMVIYHYHGRKNGADGYALFRNYSIGGGALSAKYLFKAPYLCRQFLWDIKNAMREIVTGKNSFMPEIAFSHRDKVRYCVLGFSKYFFESRAWWKGNV